MSHYPPNNSKEWIRLLLKLGFVEKNRIGIGGHAHKFIHPDRHPPRNSQQPDFIIIPHKIYNILSKEIIKEIKAFGFTEEDIRDCC